VDDREKEQAAKKSAANRELVRRAEEYLKGTPGGLESEASEGMRQLAKELIVAQMALDAALEDWASYCAAGLDEHQLYRAAREEVASPLLATDDREGEARRVSAEVFLLAFQKLHAALDIVVAETNLEWGDLA
jgi:hypothetical protein